MRTSNFALRLQHSLMEEAKAMAKSEGVALNQLINIAVAEKLAAMRTVAFFERYTRNADVGRAMGILSKAGRNNPPMPGDELPEGWDSKPRKSRVRRKPAGLTRSKSPK